MSSHDGATEEASPEHSNFSPSDILPQPYPDRPGSDSGSMQVGQPQPVFGAPKDAPHSPGRSDSPPSVFGNVNGQRSNAKKLSNMRESDEQESYDLNPPPPSVSHKNLETLAERFFSADHLDFILRDPSLGVRFTKFVETYKSQYVSTLRRYVDTRKAILAVQFGNAVAAQIPAGVDRRSNAATSLDESFETSSREAAEDLVEEVLPCYLTNRFVALVTETMVKEITGNNSPLMRQLVPSLAEVYCMTDPSLPDNPIIYASEEFYNTTQYGRDYVNGIRLMGKNCRFLQGPKTSHSAVRRLIEAISAGEDTCELILNYRRDGSAFFNLLMTAPLYDNKGEVRYFLGSQIDVSPLVEDGKGLESFAQLLSHDRSVRESDFRKPRDPLDILGDLAEMLSEPEAKSVLDRMRGGSQDSGRSTPIKRRPTTRRYLSRDETNQDGASAHLWPDLSLGHSGRLPGVYRNYMLVRPHPSLRITFTSPALRIPGLLQTKLLDRIGGPQSVRDGILDALTNDTSVTAKITWLTNSAEDERSQYLSNPEGKQRWIHCTPLFGSDEKCGVWMIVMVEEEEISGQLNRRVTSGSNRSSSRMKLGEEDRRSTGNVLYADYLREDKNARAGTPGSQQTSTSARERHEVNEQFRDF